MFSQCLALHFRCCAGQSCAVASPRRLRCCRSVLYSAIPLRIKSTHRHSFAKRRISKLCLCFSALFFAVPSLRLSLLRHCLSLLCNSFPLRLASMPFRCNTAPIFAFLLRLLAPRITATAMHSFSRRRISAAGLFLSQLFFAFPLHFVTVLSYSSAVHLICSPLLNPPLAGVRQSQTKQNRSQ